MGFLEDVNQKKTTNSTSSRFLADVASVPTIDPARAARNAELSRNAAATREADSANSVGGLVRNTASGVGDILKSIGIELTRPLARYAVNVQKAATGTFDDTPVDLPIYGPTRPVGVSGDWRADLKDILGTGTEVASNVIPATRIKALAKAGTVTRGVVEGATTGAIAGGLNTAGREAQNPDSTFRSITSEGVKGILLGAGLGGAVGGGVAAVSARRAARATKPTASFLDEVSEAPVATAKPPTTPIRAAQNAVDGPITNAQALADLDTVPVRPLRPVESQGPAQPSALSASVEAQAIEKKLTDHFSDLPQYNRVSMAEQAQKATALIDEDLAKARRIALGEELPPNDILPESVFVALEDRALATGDVETLRALATRSSLSTEATAMGQRLRALAERDADSPVAVIQEVQQLRSAKFEKRTGKSLKQAKSDTVKEIQESIQKAAPTKQTWDEFINTLECNY